jgi:uncharacterized membrane protein
MKAYLLIAAIIAMLVMLQGCSTSAHVGDHGVHAGASSSGVSAVSTESIKIADNIGRR